MRIYLLGFMGCGKTRIASLLADLLSYRFVDMDLLIERTENKSISELFGQYGEDYFREKERFQLLETLQYDQAVIATGGGAPCFFDNMDWMNENGLTIFLNVPVQVLGRRLSGARSTRPLLANLKDAAALTDFIHRRLGQRSRFYSKAIKTMDCGEKSADVLAKEIKKYVDHRYKKNGH